MARPALAASLEAVLGDRGNANRVFEILELLAVRGAAGARGGGGARRGAASAALTAPLFPRPRRRRTCCVPHGRAAGCSPLCCGGESCSPAVCLPRRTRCAVSGDGRGGERSRERPRGRGVGASAPRLYLAGNYSAEEKYKIWMRHRYNDCVESLSELLGHDSFQVKVSCGTVAGMRVCGVAAVTARRGRWECCRAFLGLRRPSALLGNAVHVAFSPSSPCGPGHRRAPPGDGCL